MDDPDLDEDFPAKLNVKDIKVPVKAQSQLKKALYDRSRIKHNGPAKTHMPEFNKSLSHKSKSYTDPYDKEWMSSYLRNPLGESSAPRHKTPVGLDTLSCLKNMVSSSKFKGLASSDAGSTKILTENDENSKLNVEDDYLDTSINISEKRNVH